MDITLERILSLIPQDEIGKPKHGAQSDFARSIGYKDGHVISMWRNGSSDTYKSKLSDIALKTGVSVAWLKGETDDPTPQPQAVQIDRMIDSMSREELQALIVRASELLRDK